MAAADGEGVGGAVADHVDAPGNAIAIGAPRQPFDEGLHISRDRVAAGPQGPLPLDALHRGLRPLALTFAETVRVRAARRPGEQERDRK